MKAVHMAVIVALVMVLALMGLAGGNARWVQAAPLAAPTPVTAVNGGGGWILTTMFAGTSAIAADTRSSCFETAAFKVADIQYNIDQGTTNTTTLTIQHTNDQVTFVDGINVVADNAADASSMVQTQVFGRYTCLLANVTNSNNITITASAVFK